MPDARDELTVINVGGNTSIDLALGWHAHTVYVENYTNQYVSLPDIVSFVPPYTARLLALPGVQKAKMLFAPPPGITQVASVASQVCTATWSERSVPVTGGPIGPIGVTSNYYDRNPLAIYAFFSSNGVGPAALTVRATYTAPANRKAFVETVALFARRRTVAAPIGTWAPGVNITPAGGAAQTIVYVRNTLNTVDSLASWGTSTFGLLLPGDKMDLFTEDLSTGGSVDYTLSLKATEYDS